MYRCRLSAPVTVVDRLDGDVIVADPPLVLVQLVGGDGGAVGARAGSRQGHRGWLEVVMA